MIKTEKSLDELLDEINSLDKQAENYTDKKKELEELIAKQHAEKAWRKDAGLEPDDSLEERLIPFDKMLDNFEEQAKEALEIKIEFSEEEIKRQKELQLEFTIFIETRSEIKNYLDNYYGKTLRILFGNKDKEQVRKTRIMLETNEITEKVTEAMMRHDAKDENNGTKSQVIYATHRLKLLAEKENIRL